MNLYDKEFIIQINELTIELKCCELCFSGSYMYNDVDTIFSYIDKEFYDCVFNIDLSVSQISGNLWKLLPKFKNLKYIDVPYNIDKYIMDELEYRYNNNVVIKYKTDYQLKYIFEFYKNYQDDPFYKSDLFGAGLVDVDFLKIKNMFDICTGMNKDSNLNDIFKLAFDNLHKKHNYCLILKNKFDMFYKINLTRYD